MSIFYRGSSSITTAGDKARNNVKAFYRYKLFQILKLIDEASKNGKEYIEIPEPIDGPLITMLKNENLCLGTGLNSWIISWVI